MTTQDAAPLWSDERINMLADNMPTAWEAKRVHDLMVRIRNEYENERATLTAQVSKLEGVLVEQRDSFWRTLSELTAERATLTAQLDEKDTRIAKLEQEIEEVREQLAHEYQRGEPRYDN